MRRGTGSGGRGSLVGLTVLALLIGGPGLARAPSAEGASGGKVRFIRNATTSFDPVVRRAGARQHRWMRRHYWRMRGYSPFFERALGWAPRTHVYQDLYAIYRDRAADRRLVSRHPNWVLRDWLGRPLFIPWRCNGSTCPQYAADIGSPGWRSHWIATARERLRRGYAGVFIDDVNLPMTVSAGNGTPVRPFDPRTLAPMTDADWRRYMAEFTEQIRAALPRAEIVHNSIWWLDHADPFVQRQVAAADTVELERGFNDSGIVGGAGRFGYETLLAHVDWLHSQGASALYEPHGLDAPARQFELASYFLARARGDAIASDYRADPGNWWRGWQVSLGAASGPRFQWKGLWRRDFERGIVLVNPPGGSTTTVPLPAGAFTDLRRRAVRSVTLAGRRGAILRRSRRPR